MLNLEQLELKSDDDGCQFSQLRKLLVSVAENITLLAETGYGEGEICHRLVHPMIDKGALNFINGLDCKMDINV